MSIVIGLFYSQDKRVPVVLQGQWYAKKIVEETREDRSRGVDHQVIIIDVDTTSDIPDELFDPESLAPEQLRLQ